MFDCPQSERRWTPFGATLTHARRTLSAPIQVMDRRRTALDLERQDRQEGAERGIYLVLAVGLDSRTDHTLSILTAESGEKVAAPRLWCAYPLQPFLVEITADNASKVLQQGIRVSTNIDSADLSIIESGNEIPQVFLPHITDDSTATVYGMLELLESLASLQRFGWMEACVLQGLSDIKAPQAYRAIEAHLGQYLTAGGLLYGDDFSGERENTLCTIEACGPFATISAVENFEANPAVSLFVEFYQARTERYGLARDPTGITTEGILFADYPAVVTALRRDDNHLLRTAVDAAVTRARSLLHSGCVYQLRSASRNGELRMPNWSRGVAWFLLGLVRIAEALPLNYLERGRLIGLLREGIFIATDRYRRENGAWPCQLDSPSMKPDLAGTSGIAAAIEKALFSGFLSLSEIRKTDYDAGDVRDLIVSNVRAEGFLAGVAQENKGGEELQYSDYRVLSQFGAGLAAQFLMARAANGS